MSDVLPDEVKDRLTSGTHVAFLGTCHAGNPHVAPLWYNFYDGHLEIATTGRKLANIRENPRVSLAIQQDHDGHPEWGLVIQGTAQVIESEGVGRDILRRINRRYDVAEDAWSENTPVEITPGTVQHWTY